MKIFIKFLFIVAISSVIIEGYLCIYPIKKGAHFDLNKIEVIQANNLHSEISESEIKNEINFERLNKMGQHDLVLKLRAIIN